MMIIYTLLIFFLTIALFYCVRIAVFKFKLWYFFYYLDKLSLDYKIYNIHKEQLKTNNFSYETVFCVSYKSDDLSFVCTLSQKQFISMLYERIEKIDNIIIQIPENVIEEELKMFYELRRLIRTEKLINEKTTD